MPRFYFVGVCMDSSLDQASNNFSLFNLVEQVQVPKLPIALPAEVHIYAEFEEAERGRPHELRITLEDEQGTIVWQSQASTIISAAARYRTVGQGLRLLRPGLCRVVAEIRPAGDVNQPWARSPMAWPVQVVEGPTPTQPGDAPAPAAAPALGTPNAG